MMIVLFICDFLIKGLIKVRELIDNVNKRSEGGELVLIFSNKLNDLYTIDIRLSKGVVDIKIVSTYCCVYSPLSDKRCYRYAYLI